MELLEVFKNYNPTNYRLKDIKAGLQILCNFIDRTNLDVSSDTYKFFRNLLQLSILDNDFVKGGPESYRYYESQPNTITFYNESGRRFENFKSFNIDTVRPNTILSKKEVLSYAHLGSKIYFDIKRNILFINYNSLSNNFSADETKSAIQFGIYLLNEQLDNETKPKFAEFVKILAEKDNFHSEIDDLQVKVLEEVKEDMLSSIPNKIGQQIKVNLRHSISEFSSKINNLKREITKTADSMVLAEYALEHSEKEVEKINSYIRALYKDNLIRTIQAESNWFMITTQPLQVAFYDTEQLERVVTQNQLNLGQSRLQALEKVLNYEAKLMMLPLTIEMDIDVTSSSSTSSYGLRFSFNQSLCPLSQLTNAHATFSRSGCVGSFRGPMEIARAEGNIQGMLALAMQYIRSLTVHDAMGNRMLKSLIITDNDNKIINCPEIPEYLMGVDIFDMVNYNLYAKSKSYVEKFKEEHYGSKTNG